MITGTAKQSTTWYPSIAQVCSTKIVNRNCTSKAIHPKKWWENFPATKIALESLGTSFVLICIGCMWFHFRIGQNGIGKNTL